MNNPDHKNDSVAAPTPRNDSLELFPEGPRCFDCMPPSVVALTTMSMENLVSCVGCGALTVRLSTGLQLVARMAALEALLRECEPILVDYARQAPQGYATATGRWDPMGTKALLERLRAALKGGA